MNINIIKLKAKLPPLLKNGNGTPVNGIIAVTPNKFINKCPNINEKVPYANNELVKVSDCFDIFNILYNITKKPIIIIVTIF